MTAWLDGSGRVFNPDPTITVVPLAPGRSCVVVDDALANPEGLRVWADSQVFAPPMGYPYPGLVCDVPGEMQQRVADFFTQHVRRHLGVRRVASLATRLSVISTPPERLDPIQWMCHRDRLAEANSGVLFAASVLYLFHEPEMGGTSFYAPRLPMAETELLVAHSQTLRAREFGARYELQPGYISGSNQYFERIAQVPAAWNRLIFYDGGLFHSADVSEAALLHPDPMRGRLTLNSFITCRRVAS